jgi:rhomboid family protein
MVVPIYDDNPFSQPVKPVVTWLLIATNLTVFFYEAAASQAALESLLETFSLIPAALFGHMPTPGRLPAFLTPITYQFFHADIMHVLGNMIFLWVFGDDIERELGRWHYFAFYLLCGVVGGLVFAVSAPQSKIELIGASGSIAGVVVAYAMLRPCARVTVLVWVIPMRIAAYWVIGMFVLTQLWNLGASSKSEVAYWCHFGGMLAGAVLFPLMKQSETKLFDCAPHVPDTIVQIGPRRSIGRPSGPGDFR